MSKGVKNGLHMWATLYFAFLYIVYIVKLVRLKQSNVFFLLRPLEKDKFSTALNTDLDFNL